MGDKKITLNGKEYFSKEAIIDRILFYCVEGRDVHNLMPSSYETECLEYCHSIVGYVFGEETSKEFESRWFAERFIERTIKDCGPL